MRKGIVIISAMLLAFCLVGCSFGKVEDQKMGINNEIFGLSLDEIWEIDNKTDLVVAMYDYVGRKCSNGKNIDKLSEPERVIYITQELEMEVNNGGFSQYLYNSGGDFANELVLAYTELGAPKTAEICKTAMGAFGVKIPTDRDKREDFLDNAGEEADDILDVCDGAFYEYEEDLTTISYDYIMKNKESFS